MTETAAASGAANDVTVVTGPPLPDHMALAVALVDASTADGNVARMEAKLAKARQAGQDLVDTAEAALEDAQAAQAVADQRVSDLMGEDGGEAAVAALKAAADEARSTYEQAAGRLGGGE